MGLIFNIAPGAVFTQTIRAGVKGGFYNALAVQFGSLVGDFLWVVLGLSGAAVLFTLPLVELPLTLAGALLLGFLAFQSFRDALNPPPILKEELQSSKNYTHSLFVGAGISIGNPLNITYWAALGGLIASLTQDTPSVVHFAFFVFGFMLSSVLWCFVASFLVAYTSRYLSRATWQAVNSICGISLAGLMVWQCFHIYSSYI